MNLLIVYAHPSPISFNAALRDAAADEARGLGHDVIVSDLYAEGFRADGGPDDFLAPVDVDHFHYQSEQRAAALTNGFAPDIAREQERLRWADALILQFPIWWGGPPAILKGWIDRVSAYGVAYADGTRFDTGLFTGRPAMLSVTTGGSAQRFSNEGEYGPIERALWPIQQLFLRYLGYDLAEPCVAYAAPRQEPVSRSDMIATLRSRVSKLLARPPSVLAIPSPQDLLGSLGTRNWTSTT